MAFVLGAFTLTGTLTGMEVFAATSGIVGAPGPQTVSQVVSPFTNYTAGVAIYVLMIGFLVAVLLIGGMLVINLGLLSKRAEDRVGGRTPSDLGLLRNSVWPMEPVDKRVLPAEEDMVPVSPLLGISKPPGISKPSGHSTPAA